DAAEPMDAGRDQSSRHEREFFHHRDQHSHHWSGATVLHPPNEMTKITVPNRLGRVILALTCNSASQEKCRWPRQAMVPRACCAGAGRYTSWAHEWRWLWRVSGRFRPRP